MTNAIEIFYSYAREDEALCKELQRHLSSLRRQGLITEWYDRLIPAGMEWARAIDVHLNTASIILFLVSADFIASNYCYSVEMKRAMERHRCGEARIIPIILRPVDWSGLPFGKLQALPQDAKPITTWENRDEAFLDITKSIKEIIEEVGHLPSHKIHIHQRYDGEEQKRRILHRQNFANERVRELRQLGLKEEWKDENFTELEAEVEAVGRRKMFSFVPHLSRGDKGLRREKSLSEALELSQESRILVEGEPGSGKSVALRHIAETMAKRAAEKQSTRSIIPIYVNLKELERPNEVPIDRNLIKRFILKSLTRINDRDIDQFLDDEFNIGMREGTWFFLFDSFDELPEVLSSVEADTVIKSYGNAIDDFLGGINACRGVVASRQYRGPKYLDWPCFRVLPLSQARQLELIHRAGLKSKDEHQFIGQLGTAREEVRLRASNPLFLTLLCKHVKSGHPFPQNTHSVFETYIESRLTRDKDRLQKRYGFDTSHIRATAESIAFCMTADSKLGLSPTRENLRAAMTLFGREVDDNFDTLLDALEYMKLAHSEVEGTMGADTARTDTSLPKSFTFAHRRFQEYFATCVVLREPSLFSPKQLFTNDRWRETAVTMCQTQPIETLEMILKEADQCLKQCCEDTPGLIDDPMEYVRRKERKASKSKNVPEGFSWPSGSLHLLGLLQEGFSARSSVLPYNIRLSAAKLVLSGTEVGILPDRKWALEVSGIVPEPILAYLLKKAFSSTSQLLKEAAYRQVARLSSMPSAIAQGIRDAIADLACTNQLHREKHATEAHLARIAQSTDFLSAMRLLLWIPRLDIAWHIVFLLAILSILLKYSIFTIADMLFFCLVIFLSHISLCYKGLSLEPVMNFKGNEP